MAQLVNKDGDAYKAIVGKTVYSESLPIEESADYNCGAIANEFELLRAYLDQLITYFDSDAAEEEYLEILVDFLLGLARIFDESDSNLRDRLNAYLRRNGNPRWMTIWSMIDIFSYFFTAADIYYEENYIETDLITDGGFEDYTSPPIFDSWSKTEAGSSTVTQETGAGNVFQDLASAKFSIDSSNSLATLSQTVNGVAAGDHKISFWYRDDDNCPADDVVEISLQRSSDSNYYQWDGTWDTGEVFKAFPKSTSWKIAEAYFDNEGTENLTYKIANSGSSGAAYIFYVDRFMSGIWQTYSSFKLLLAFSLEQGAYSMLWESVDGEDNLMDRGECEETTSPMIRGETTPVLSNALWARDAAEFYFDTHSYKFTKNIAAGTSAVVDLVDNNSNSDMHGLSADTEYTFIVRVKIPSSGMLGSEITVEVGDYASAAWQFTSQACALVYAAWQYVKVTRTIRAAATGTILRIKAHSDAAISEVFYNDDVRFAKGTPGDLEFAAYIGQDFIQGPGGGYTSDYYINLLDKAKPAGVKAAVENIGKTV